MSEALGKQARVVTFSCFSFKICVCLSAATWVGGGFILGIAEATYNPTLGAVWALMPVPYVLTFFLGEWCQ